MQSTGSQPNSELYAEISGEDLNGKAFPSQEDIELKKKKIQYAGNNNKEKKLAKKGSKE